MVNLVRLTELIFNGKTLIIYILICQNFGVLYQMTSKQSNRNENCNEGLQEKCIFKQMSLKMSASLHTKVTAWT